MIKRYESVIWYMVETFGVIGKDLKAFARTKERSGLVERMANWKYCLELYYDRANHLMLNCKNAENT